MISEKSGKPNETISHFTKHMEMDDPAVNNLKNWVLANGGAMLDIHYPTMFEGFLGFPYKGIATHQTIVPLQKIISIPSTIILSTEHAYHSELNPLFHHYAKIFGPYNANYQKIILSTYIMAELGKGKSSKWAPLFEVWKQTEICNYYTWSFDEIKQIPSLPMRNLAFKQREVQRKLWTTLAAIFERYKAVFKPQKYINFQCKL